MTCAQEVTDVCRSGGAYPETSDTPKKPLSAKSISTASLGRTLPLCASGCNIGCLQICGPWRSGDAGLRPRQQVRKARNCQRGGQWLQESAQRAPSPAAVRRRPPATAQSACASNAESCGGGHAQRRVPLQDGNRHAQDTASRDSQPPCSSRSHATSTWAGDISVCLRAFQRPIADRASAGVRAPSCRATQCTVASSSMP